MNVRLSQPKGRTDTSQPAHCTFQSCPSQTGKDTYGPLRAATSSDKLLLLIARKNRERQTRLMGTNPCAVATSRCTSIWTDQHWHEMDVGFLQKGDAYISRNPHYLKVVCSCHHHSFVLAVSKLSILFQEVW